MKVLLVSSPKSVMGFDRVTKLPNLGLNSLAASLKHLSATVKVLDLVLVKNPGKYLTDFLASFNPDVVGMSCMTFQYPDTLNLAKRVKSFNPEIKVILGGYHPTVDAETILEHDHPPIDYVMRNEGENAFPTFIEALKKQKDFKSIPSFSYVDNGRVRHNPKGELLPLQNLPMPDRSCRVIKDGFHILGRKADVVETSRGCVNHCKFCSIKQMYGPKFRKYELARVIEDIKDAKAYGAEAILFSDDNITVDVRRMETLCHAIIENQLNDISYAVQTSIPGLKKAPHLPELMSKAGIDICFMGIENSVQNNLNYLDSKQILTMDTRTIVQNLKKHGMTVIGSFIIGNPEDTREMIYENFKFANAIDLDIPLFLILTPFPKTEVREELLAENLITNSDDYAVYDLFHANVRTRHLSGEELEAIRDELGFMIFKKPLRILKLLKKYPGYSMKVLWEQVITQPQEVFGYAKGMFK